MDVKEVHEKMNKSTLVRTYRRIPEEKVGSSNL